MVERVSESKNETGTTICGRVGGGDVQARGGIKEISKGGVSRGRAGMCASLRVREERKET